MSEASPPETESTARDLSGAVHWAAKVMQHQLSTGDLAALRRADPGTPPPAAFWRLAVDVLEPAGELSQEGRWRDEVERKWSTLFQGMAILGPLVRRGTPAGKALATAGFSEARFTRLMRSEGPGLHDELIRASRFLAAKNQAVDFADFAWLLLAREETAEKTRRRIARDFYDVQFRPSSNDKDTES